jgi:hypothetical protein
MRIVGFFLNAIFFLVIAAALVYFVGSSMWLAIGSRQFISDTNKLVDLLDNPSTNTKRCRTAPASSNYSVPKAVQLRFLDDKKYIVELVCTLIENTPVQIAQGSLPYLISKDPGSSGFYVDLARPQASTVTLRSLYAHTDFNFSGKLLPSGQKITGDKTSSSPITACAGWGYQCCQSPSEMGSGKSESSGVLDCPTSCFSVCSPRPYIVSFIADPYPSTGNIVAMESDSVTVTFSYTADLTGGKIAGVNIDYGDGQKDSSTESTGVFTHTYSCSGPCKYTASITASDANGNSSLASDTTTLYIVRK